MISVDQYLMGRQKEYKLTKEDACNMATLLSRVNYLIGLLAKEEAFKSVVVSSGWRPGKYNTKAGGSLNSTHMSCSGVDLLDSDGNKKKLITIDLLEKCDLYMENPEDTPNWLHLDTRKRKNRIFKP